MFPTPDQYFEMHVDQRRSIAQHCAQQHGDPGRIRNRQYLSPSVYFEGMTTELEMMNNLMQRLPPQAQAALVQALSQFDRGLFMANDDSVTLMCRN